LVFIIGDLLDVGKLFGASCCGFDAHQLPVGGTRSQQEGGGVKTDCCYCTYPDAFEVRVLVEDKVAY